jgi:hypothetical protein
MAKKASKSKKSATKKFAKKRVKKTGKFDPFRPGHRVFKKKSGG